MKQGVLLFAADLQIAPESFRELLICRYSWEEEKQQHSQKMAINLNDWIFKEKVFSYQGFYRRKVKISKMHWVQMEIDYCVKESPQHQVLCGRVHLL